MKIQLIKNNGFGLIEVMTSIVVMVIVVGAAGTVTSQSIKTALGAQESIVASGLAQELIEEARLSRDKNPEGPITVNFPAEIKLNNIDYKQFVQISDKKDSALYKEAYWDIIVKITWHDSRNNKEKQYIINSILTQW